MALKPIEGRVKSPVQSSDVGGGLFWGKVVATVMVMVGVLVVVVWGWP